MQRETGSAGGDGTHGSGASETSLPALADQTLNYFEHAVATAQEELTAGKGAAPDALASVNTLTSLASQNLSGISEEARRNLEAVIAQPAIARVEVVNEAGHHEVIFITPGGAPRGRWGNVRVASYHSPMGRLASTRPGRDVDIPTPGGPRTYEVVGRAQLHPERDLEGWDSRNTVVEALAGRTLTVVSLRALLRIPSEDEGGALAALELELQLGAEALNVYEGVRRSVLERIGFRARPVLDEYQDEILRLPLDCRVAILGPPGSGKTTTLIKRLRFKLDLQGLEDELPLIDRTVAGRKGLGDSWLMFSPTELLRLYVKEAFNRERVPASEQQIQVWDTFRRETARNRLGILRSANSSGAMLRDSLENLQASAIENQIRWFEDFDSWQRQTFWSELREHAARLSTSEDARISGLATRLARTVQSGAAGSGAAPFVQFRAISREVGERAAELQAEIDLRLRTAFALELKSDAELLSKLNTFVRTLGDGVEVLDDIDEVDVDDEDEEVVLPARAQINQAFDTYLRAMRAQARALADGRRLGNRTRYGRVFEWLGDHAMPEDELKKVGSSVLVAASLRRLANPMRAYLNGVRSRYRRFRRQRQSEGVWYDKVQFGPMDLSPLEVDVVLLAMLRIGRMLLADPRIASAVAETSMTSLSAVRDLFQTQILVDEATDFSPIQLGCMAALCDPAADSFLACGDFNQRITPWGARSDADLKWVFPDIDIHKIRITYRHSRQLNALAHAIASLSDGEHQEALLPDDVDNEGVDPVYGGGLVGDALAGWLANRIAEIERLTQSLPSIAVLVNGEAKVQPMADILQAALASQNIQCVACPGGLVKGNDGDVRVFDVQHIKGLEFEAVFFVGVDELAELKPELFDKFLYVGATRAAMYLGLTSKAESPPKRLLPIIDRFRANWE